MTNKEFLCDVHLFERNASMSLHAYLLMCPQSLILLIFKCDTFQVRWKL